jgi:hypothetical protein
MLATIDWLCKSGPGSKMTDKFSYPYKTTDKIIVIQGVQKASQQLYS